MAKVPLTGSISNVKTTEDIKRFASVSIGNIIQQINGNLTLSDNLSVSTVDYTFTEATTKNQVKHNLNRVPIGYSVIGINGGAIVYQVSLDAKDANTIDLYCNQAGIMTRLLFY